MSKSRLLEQRDRIRSVMYNPADKDKIILCGSTYMCLVDIHEKPASKKLGKRKNQHVENTKPKTDDEMSVSISYQYQQILFCDFIGENQMVMVERPKFDVLQKLPPSFYKAHFGA